MNWKRVRAVARNDLLQLKRSPDFLIPMGILAGVFFIFVPVVLLSLISIAGDVPAVSGVAESVGAVPAQAQATVDALSEQAQTSYSLAVFLFAPLGVIVPMTICTAVGANAVVNERERGTGEFLAHSPATEKEIYFGKLIASLTPGYATTLVGFGVYSIIVNVIVGPDVGGWFFPTSQWWMLMLWIVPAFLAITLSVVLRLSARVQSATAAQQASGLVTLPLIIVSWAQSSVAIPWEGSFVIGAVAWVVAFFGLRSGAKAVTRERLVGAVKGHPQKSR